MHVIQKLKNILLDTLYPPLCAVCSAEGVFLCTNCTPKLPVKSIQTCPVCFKSSPFGAVCSSCTAKTSLDGLLVAFNYEYQPIQELIKTFKYRYAEDISVQLASLLAFWLFRNQKGTHKYVVPVPLHTKKKKQRGFNQTELLARELSKRITAEYSPLLERTRYTDIQAQLSREERKKNVKDCFTCLPDVNPAGVYIVVDDVASTLSTLDECAGELKKKGAGKVWGCVIARGS